MRTGSLKILPVFYVADLQVIEIVSSGDSRFFWLKC